MRVMKQAVLANVVIFDRKDLSVNGLGTEKFHGHFSLVDFIIKDRDMVLKSQLVLYDTGKELRFVKANIGKTIEDYNTFQKHIHEMNKELIFEVGELKKKENSIIIVEDGEDFTADEIKCGTAELGQFDGVRIIVDDKKLEEKDVERNKTIAGHKKVRKGKNNTNSSRTTRRVK